jgi:HK97 family phage portal protein
MLERTRNWLAGLILPDRAVEPVQALAPKPLTGGELLELLGASNRSSAGVDVNERTAMCVSSVYACTALIGGAISSCPFNLFNVTKDGPERVDEYSQNAVADLWWLLNVQPHPAISAAVFWEYVGWSLLLHGDFFAPILRNGNSPRAAGFLPIHPRNVQVFPDLETGTGWPPKYFVQQMNGELKQIPYDDIIHIPGIGFDGLRGMSVIKYAAKQAIGTALAAEEFSAKFFGNGAKPDFALKSPEDLSPEAVATLRATWQSRYGGAANSHLPAILTGGLELAELTMNAEDAALIATRQFQVIDIARIFGVPPHMIGETEKASSWGTGIEAMGIGFVKYTLQRHLTKIEQEFNRKLFAPTRARTYGCFDVEGLLRGDSKSRAEYYRAALGGSAGPGWMAQNEIRTAEGLRPNKDAGADKLTTWSQENAKPPSAPAGGKP